MLAGKRSVRVGDLILREIASILLEKINDPRIKSISLTGISLSRDLKMAKIYYSVGGEMSLNKIRTALEKATGFIKRELGKRISLKYMPEIKFYYDSSVSTGIYMDKLFDTLHLRDDIEDDTK